MVEVRPIRPDDDDALAEYFRGLDEESVRLRFNGGGQPSLTAVRRLADVSRPAAERLIALAGDVIVGEIGYGPMLRLPEGEVELGFSVAPEWRRRRVASALLEALTEIAAEQGIRSYYLLVCVENTVVRTWAERLGGKLVGPCYPWDSDCEYRLPVSAAAARLRLMHVAEPAQRATGEDLDT